MAREQVLYTIYKLTTSFICQNNLNIERYPLKQAGADGCLVSIGDNILLDRIRDYRGDHRSYKQIFNDIEILRRSLKKAKMEGKTKEIKIINQILLKTLFVPDIVNVEATSKTEFRKVAKAGFYLNGCRYVTFTAGAGQLRRNTVTFIKEDLNQPMFKLLCCGIDEKVKEINIAKFSAYFALTSSSIMWVDTPRCCVIKDFETIVPNQKVDWICKRENGEGYVEERIIDVKLNSADGQGLICPEMARVWAENMRLDYVPSQFVVRSAYIKGNFPVFDFREYAHKHGINTITDRYGVTYNIDEIDCLISESQFKMYKYYESWQEYLSYTSKAGIKWGVARYNKKEDPIWSQINYQFIQLLDIDQDGIKELIQPTIDWIQKICSGDTLYSLLYCFGGFNETDDIEYNDIYTRAQNLAMKAVVKDPKFLQDSYVQRKIYRNIVEAINRAKIGKIWARGNYQFMISDPIAQCQSALGLPVKGAIPGDCIYSNFWNNLGVTGKVMVGRNPCIDEHELNPCDLYRDEETDYWYQHLKSGIIMSIYDTGVNRIEDADFDGDIVCTLDNPLFVNGSHKHCTNIIMYDKQAAPSHKINHRNLVEGYINGFGSKVGVYSNHATIIEALKALFAGEDKQKQRDELERRKKLLREVVGAEIDSAKGLAKPKEPWYFTKFVTVDPDDDDATKAEKYYHNSLVISKKPYFFRYLYPELNKKYKQYENAYNEKSKALFGTKLKKLLVKENKTDAEKTLIRRYHKFSPVISTNCTMNILCRDFESIDFDIQWGKSEQSMLPHYDLDEFKFNPEILKKIRTLYQKWNNKKAIAYVENLYTNEEDAEYRECRFSVIDAIRNSIQSEYIELGLKPMEGLTYIAALAQSYAKFNWGFAWDLLENAILDCIDENDALAPVECSEGEEYLGRKYILKNIPKEKKHYSIDPETGEITFFGIDDDFNDLNLDDFELDKEDDYEDESTNGIFNVFYDEGI